MSHFNVSEAFLRVTTDWTNAQKNLDPEQLKEVQESQARMVKMQSSITSGDLGRWVPLVPISAPLPLEDTNPRTPNSIASMFAEGSGEGGSSSATVSTPVKSRGKKRR